MAHFPEHARRVTFEVSHRLCQRHWGRQGDEKMDVVCSSSCREQGNVLGFGDSRDVTAERVRVLYEVGAVFSAEDAMHQVRSVGVRHAEMVMKDSAGHRDRRHIGMFDVPSLRDSGFFSRLPSAEALG